MGRLLEGIEGEKPERGLDGWLGGAGRALLGEQPSQSPERDFVQPLALSQEPVFERRLLDGEALEQVALVESGSVGER